MDGKKKTTKDKTKEKVIKKKNHCRLYLPTFCLPLPVPTFYSNHDTIIEKDQKLGTGVFGKVDKMFELVKLKIMQQMQDQDKQS